ncbi:MAG: hypothetical protein KDH20_22485, partial [Rhodocyclaceae bacterium]|nr:hypothetical protein [Rhodocyclaceae bacterium]
MVPRRGWRVDGYRVRCPFPAVTCVGCGAAHLCHASNGKWTENSGDRCAAVPAGGAATRPLRSRAAMSKDRDEAREAFEAQMHAEMSDRLDEELEMEFDDERMEAILQASGVAVEAPPDMDARLYFSELLRLQGELVKLQDWVVHHKLKLVVLFEGRDAAGKGGVINRITQRLNPRVCHVAALPAPTERERSQWYFQRYVAQFPTGGEMVL